MRLRTFFFGLILLALTGCGSQEARLTPSIGVYQPPSVLATNSILNPAPTHIESNSPAEEVRPSPTPACTNSLWFLEDLTIPDGTLVDPGERLDKRWFVRNNGTCNWNDQYQVKLIAGSGMGVPVRQSLFPALSGTDVVIRMIFIAPDEPGSHRSAWQVYDPSGEPFGDPFFIDIVVPEE